MDEISSPPHTYTKQQLISIGQQLLHIHSTFSPFQKTSWHYWGLQGGEREGDGEAKSLHSPASQLPEWGGRSGYTLALI